MYLNDLEIYMDLYDCKCIEIGIHDDIVLFFSKIICNLIIFTLMILHVLY